VLNFIAVIRILRGWFEEVTDRGLIAAQYPEQTQHDSGGELNASLSWSSGELAYL